MKKKILDTGVNLQHAIQTLTDQINTMETQGAVDVFIKFPTQLMPIELDEQALKKVVREGIAWRTKKVKELEKEFDEL